MMGHSIKSIPMAEIYNLPTTEMLFTEYKKAIPELIIDATARKQAEIDNILSEQNDTVRIANEFTQYKKDTDAKMARFEKLIDEKWSSNQKDPTAKK